MIGFEELIYLFSTPSNTRGICRLNYDEAAMLYKYCRLCSGDVVELGRWDAGSTIIMAAATQKIIYSIDIRKRIAVKKSLNSLPFSYRNRIELIHGDSSTVGKNWTIPISLVFIDGDHTLSGVRKDIITWQDHILPGGYMLLHDVMEYGESKIDKIIKKFDLSRLLPLLAKKFECVDASSSLIVLRKRK